MTTVAVSGGFDPLHVGHLNLLKMARALGRVVVIVDSDEYVRSKHKLGMPLKERVRIVESLADVDACIPNKEPSGNCAAILYLLRPDIFLVGPDKELEQIPEFEICKDFGINVVRADSLTKEHSSRDYAPPRYNNPPVCVSVIVQSKPRPGTVLVGQRQDNGKWDLPGGFLEEKESLEDCARREVREEFGVELYGPVVYQSSTFTNYNDGRIITLAVFHAMCVGTPVVGGEMVDYAWVTELPANMNNAGDAAALMSFFRGK